MLVLKVMLKIRNADSPVLCVDVEDNYFKIMNNNNKNTIFTMSIDISDLSIPITL